MSKAFISWVVAFGPEVWRLRTLPLFFNFIIFSPDSFLEPLNKERRIHVGKVVVVNNITLDGVMQAPARADEDTRNGFKYGGWGIPFNDPVMGKKMAELMAKGSPHGALLLGRANLRGFLRSLAQTKRWQSLYRASQQSKEICGVHDLARAASMEQLPTTQR